MTQFAIICGSHRNESQSLKVSRFIEKTINKSISHIQPHLISLSNNPLPLWDESFWTNDPKWDVHWKPFSEILKKSDAVVVVSPEWSGMVPAGLKNFFLFCQKYELAHKPGLIVTVSSGTGGAYPVAELRMSSYKNTYFCYIPEHIIIRKVEDVLNDFSNSNSQEDEYIRKRIQYSLKVLEQYAISLKKVRESGVLNFKDYPYGM